MIKYQIATGWAIKSPPAEIVEGLDAVRAEAQVKIDALKQQIETIEAERWEQMKQVLEQMQQHPEVLKVGTKFIRWHRVHNKRIPLEVTQVTVRPVFKHWELTYICKDLAGNQVNVYAGSMKEVASV